MQIRHAIRAHFLNGVVLAVHSVESLLATAEIGRTLSSIYLRLTCQDTSNTSRLFGVWQWDIPVLTEKNWMRVYSNAFHV